MFNKKAQAGVITVIIIILLVLAAIVIVWQVVQSSVSSGATQSQAAANCVGMNLAITSVTPTAASGGKSGVASIQVKRGNDNLNLNSVIVFIQDTSNGNVQLCTDPALVGPSAMTTSTLTLTVANCAKTTLLTSGNSYRILVAPKINSNQCDAIAYSDFTAA